VKRKIQPLRNLNPKNNISDYYYFEGLNKNNVINQNIRIPKECVTVFSGISGSGNHL
jgi:excinuclease UvrABC ATPase subunit